MLNEPSIKELDKLPKLYETEDVPLEEKLIHLRFFLGESSWYVAEYDGEDLFFGYVVLNGDTYNSEWGYFRLSELRELVLLRVYGSLQVDTDLSWSPTRFGRIEL